MNQETFLGIVRDAIDRSLEVLGNKAQEYSRDGDRLSNFRKAGAMDGESPEKALKGMWKKHLISVAELIDDIPEPGKAGIDWPEKLWKEKITDAVNYLFLLEALVRERYGWIITPKGDPSNV